MNILRTRTWLKHAACIGFISALCVADGLCRDRTPEFEATVDSLVVTAYQTALGNLPCKIDSGGRPRMMDWKEVDKCLNAADESIDWDSLANRIEALREKEGLLREDMTDIIEEAFAAHAVPYSRVFKVKNKGALLPLSNSVLKYLPTESLMDLPVYDKRLKKKIGTFSGIFIYEKGGGLAAANNYKLALFQFTDLKGDLQVPTGSKILADSYGVPWEEAISKIGFRLTTQKLGFKY